MDEIKENREQLKCRAKRGRRKKLDAKEEKCHFGCFCLSLLLEFLSSVVHCKTFLCRLSVVSFLPAEVKAFWTKNNLLFPKSSTASFSQRYTSSVVSRHKKETDALGKHPLSSFSFRTSSALRQISSFWRPPSDNRGYWMEETKSSPLRKGHLRVYLGPVIDLP